MMATSIQITAPAAGARLTSPLAIAALRITGASGGAAVLHIGEVRHVLAVPAGDSVVRENITLLAGTNRLRVELGDATHEIDVEVAPSEGITLAQPAAGDLVNTRASDLQGTFEDASFPAGVISVNGFLQQFAITAGAKSFAEKIVLRPGANHVAVQIGERHVTRLVQTSFAPSRILVTLVWDTGGTDLDLYVTEPDGRSVWYRNKVAAGSLDVDRTQGFGPENYSLGGGARPGDYLVRVHYFAARSVGRSEWTARVITDEGTPAQKQRTFYGILTRSLGNQGPGKRGDDWNDICTVRLVDGQATIVGPER